MKNINLNRFSRLSMLVIIMALAGCNNTTEAPRGKYAKGVLIINEGNFSESDGSIDFYEPNSKTVTQGIYGLENDLQTSGVFQSVYFYNDYGFLIDQLGSRILVVDAETFLHVTAIESELNTPRYIVVANNKGYVSNWGNFDVNFDLPDSYIAVVSLETFEVIKKIPVGNGAEGLIAFGGNIYVANSYTNTIQAIDTDKDEIISTMEVADGPLQFVEDASGKHWLLSSSWVSGSRLGQLDLASEAILKSFEIAPSSKSLNINGAGTELFFLSAQYGADGEVYAVSATASEAPTGPIITAPNLYGLGVDPVNGDIYLGNHNAFQGNGTIIRYQQDLTLIDDFAAGRVPNGFVFRK